MRFEELDSQTLGQIGTPKATARAQELVKDQRVKYGYKLPHRLQGVVVDGHPCPVEVRIQNDRLTYVCPCDLEAGGELCPHVLALLWAWVEAPENFLQPDTVKDRLKKYSKKELLEIILDMANRVPEVRGILKEEELGLEDILESIDHIMDEVTSDSGALGDAEDKLKRAQARADRLAQAGRLAEARSIYFYLLDNILSLEDRFGKGQLFPRELKDELFEEYCQFIHEDRHLERELVQQEVEQLESRSLVARGEMDLAEVKREIAAMG
jgi:hypothetical protein